MIPPTEGLENMDGHVIRRHQLHQNWNGTATNQSWSRASPRYVGRRMICVFGGKDGMMEEAKGNCSVVEC